MPSTPPSATFPVPPPVPRLQIVDDNKFPTPSFQEWCQLMWAAIQGQNGLIVDVLLALLSDLNFAAQAQGVIDRQLMQSVLLDGLEGRVSDVAVQLDQVKMVALAAFCGASGTSSSSTANAAIYAPLVTGELPGPTAIANVDGTFIMVQVA